MASDDGNSPGGEPHRFQDWAEDMIKYLAEDIRETKKLVKETRALTLEAKKQADAAMNVANESKQQTEQLRIQTEHLRELVMVTHSEWQDFRDHLKKPWWNRTAEAEVFWYLRL